ncbi:2-hydroxychromene-2-carboxylate isomerase [Orrella sp. JC864]|uniref:2-hydroxychromene-2-carboxylate isomerase n=1 Tax=Orrella sp. JC864 TaxID=3120298 RepID=UPI0030094680
MPAPTSPSGIEMWFDFASPYSYLSLMRIQPLAARAGVQVSYQPFLLGPVFKAQGMNDTPFRLFPGRGAYLLRDVARRAERFGLPFKAPSEFPRNSLLAARLALLARDEPWYVDFCKAVFRQNFVHDCDLQAPGTMAGVLQALGQPAESWIARAGGQPAKDALRQATDAAQARGVFGAPTFFVGQELFWGDDRLEDALQWAGAPGRAAGAAQ